MEFRLLDLTVISADDLKNVNFFSKMSVYAVVSVAKTKHKIHVDKDGGRNPRWNHRLKFSIEESVLARNPNLSLIFKLRSQRFFRDREVGEVIIPINNLLDDSTTGSGRRGGCDEQTSDYQVRTSSGKSKGTLKFSYKFGAKIATQIVGRHNIAPSPPLPHPLPPPYPNPPPGYGYPLPQLPQGYGVPYPPPPQPYGYAPPLTAGYGGGYGYSASQPWEVRRDGGGGSSAVGVGMGVGLLGGLMIGEMTSDFAGMPEYE